MQVRDPVCGKSIHLAEVVAAEDDGDWTYFFCSTGCHDRFSAAPARYTGERPLHRENLKAGAGGGAGG
jgi:Cu+-exporting ATPase